MSNPLSGSQATYNASCAAYGLPKVEYHWGIRTKSLVTPLDDRALIQLFLLNRKGYIEMSEWLNNQDTKLTKPESGLWWVDQRVFTMFMLKFGPGYGVM